MKVLTPVAGSKCRPGRTGYVGADTAIFRAEIFQHVQRLQKVRQRSEAIKMQQQSRTERLVASDIRLTALSQCGYPSFAGMRK